MLRIAHITDLHLMAQTGSELYGVDTTAALEKVLRDMTSLPRVPEVIIATGDLAEDGSRITYARLRKILSGTKAPTYVLAGNHDDTSAMRTSLVSDTIHFASSARIGGWAFVFVNTRVERKDYGHVTPDELRLLEENLDQARDLPVLVALHHTPNPRCPSSDCQLVNADELLASLDSHSNVKCVIAGHTHTTVEEEHGGMYQFTTPSTFAQTTHAQLGELVDHEDYWASHELDGSRHGYRVLDLLPDGGVSSAVHWIYDD